MDSLLWNGEYYVQDLANVDAYRYQYGTGCLSDQLLGQCLAHAAGLGYVFPKNHVRAAMQSVYRHNFRRDLRGNANAQRTYVLDGEAGLLLCTWPMGQAAPAVCLLRRGMDGHRVPGGHAPDL